MHERRIGSVLVTDDADAPQGILTRHDILAASRCRRCRSPTPISQVMSAPVHTLDVAATAHDAALLMSRHGIRHVPVTQDGRVVGIVSERDLFSMQTLSIKQVSAAMRGATDVAELARWRATDPPPRRQPARPGHRCTPADRTDQPPERRADRAAGAALAARARAGPAARLLARFRLRGPRRADHRDRPGQRPRVRERRPGSRSPAWLAFARERERGAGRLRLPAVQGQRDGLQPGLLPDRGGVVRPLRPLDRTRRAGGSAQRQHLLRLPAARRHAATGASRCANSSRSRAARVPRFIKQMADNALRNRPPLDWLGGIDTQRSRRPRGGRPEDAGHGHLRRRGATVCAGPWRRRDGTRGAASRPSPRRSSAEPQESEGWCSAFEFLQMLRLQVQLRPAADTGGAGQPEPRRTWRR